MFGAMGTVGKIEFNYECDSEFTRELRANIPGVRPEDVSFEQPELTPYDDIVHLKISCNTRLSEREFVNYFGIMEIDRREFYGFDYWVHDGLLRLTLYRTQKKDVQQFGFGFHFVTKYPKEPMLWC